jgi:alpha-N-arabinofuranosidase
MKTMVQCALALWLVAPGLAQITVKEPIPQTATVEVNAGSYSVAQGVKRLPEMASVPYLDVSAAVSRDGKTLTLFSVNRSLDQDISTNLRLQGFSAAHTAGVQTLGAASPADGNDEVAPERVKPADGVEAVEPGGWTRAFRHASVTVISLDRE